MSVPKYQFAFAVLVIVIVNIGAGLLSAGKTEAVPWMLVPWAVTIAMMIWCFGIIGGLASMGRLWSRPDWRGVLIDQRNRISLSRLQLVAWSLLVISAAVSEGVINAIWGKSQPLNLNIPAELWILLGLSTASFVAAPLVLANKGQQLFTKADDSQPAWRDIFYGDDNANADQVDFSKVQQFFFTVVLIVAYGVGIGHQLSTIAPSGDVNLQFPPLDPGFIGLMAVSQIAYISYKALPHERTDAPPKESA
jgi:hypothetical protein